MNRLATKQAMTVHALLPLRPSIQECHTSAGKKYSWTGENLSNIQSMLLIVELDNLTEGCSPTSVEGDSWSGSF
jgi:hypothetical protein